MGAGTILLVALVVLIMAILFRVADGVHGPADGAPVACRDADVGGEQPLVSAKPEGADEVVASDHGVHHGTAAGDGARGNAARRTEA